MQNNRATFTELLLKGLMIFPIITVVQGIEIFDAVNRIWLAIVSMAIVARLLTYKYTLVQFFMLLATVILHVVALFFTEFPLVNFNMLFYFALWVILYVFFSKSKTQILAILDHSHAYIECILWIWTILVGISALIPACYTDKYFFSFAGSSFRLMPTVLIISALAMYIAVAKKNMLYTLFLLLPTYAALMNRSRTYFAVFFLFLFMYIYMCVRNKKIFYMLLVPLTVVLLFFASVSGIADKFIETQYTDSSYWDYWGTITNGRTEFWVWDLEAFFSLPFLQQFVGNGYNFVFDVTEQYFSVGIWAHNDVINLLMNFGYLGVVIYFWSFFQMIRVFLPKGNHVPFWVKAIFFCAVFINSMFNMSYTYLCAMISYPLFLCVISTKYSENAVEKAPSRLPDKLLQRYGRIER